MKCNRFTHLLVAGCMALLLQLSIPAGNASELLVDEEFSDWTDFTMAFPTSRNMRGWRLFGFSGSQGSISHFEEGGRKILRFARTNTSGDCGLDRLDSDKRDLVESGSHIFVRVWARKISTAATLKVKLSEFNRTNSLGIDNIHSFPLTTDPTPYQFEVILSAQTNEISVGLHMDGTGTLDILRVEVGVIEPEWRHITEDFSTWSPTNVQLPGSWERSGWNLEGTGDAMGSFALIEGPPEKHLQINHSNSAGSLEVSRSGAGVTQQPLVTESFSGWNAFSQQLPSTHIRNGWRFFGVAGALGSYQLLTSTDGPYIRLTRLNSSGDAAMDRDVAELRVPVAPGLSLHFRVWARKGTDGVSLRASLAEFNSAGNYLSLENDHLYALSNQFEMYEFFMVTSQNTAAVNPAFRVSGTGSIDILRIELTYRDPASANLIQVSPSRPLELSARAKGIGNNTRLTLGIEEFDQRGGVLLHTATQTTDLTGIFSDCVLAVTPTATTNWVNPRMILESSGTVEVASISLHSRNGSAPRILLPQGWTPNPEPILYWRSYAHHAIQIQLATGLDFQNLSWDSSAVIFGGNHFKLPPMTPNSFLFARLRVLDFDGNWSSWSDPTVIHYQPFPQCEVTSVALYDLRPVRSMPAVEAHEHLHLVSVLQGLVNRDAPNLLVRWMQTDDYWLAKLQQPGRFLEHTTTTPIATLEALLEQFADYYEGVVLWDPSVPATSNVASTVAGVNNLLPIPYRDTANSLYRRLVTGGPQLPVVVNLVGKFTGTGTIPDIQEASSGSAKNDAYRWSIVRYLESGLCDPTSMGFTIDSFWTMYPGYGGDYSNSALTNHDFIIKHKGFFWDLSVWGDEKPNDDLNQPLGTDLATLKRLFAAAAAQSGQQIIHVAGFTPWAWKYCNELYNYGGSPAPFGKHGGVETEWETVRILSSYNAFIDADAFGLVGLANASFYNHMPLPERFNFSPPPQLEDMQSAGFINTSGDVAPRTYWINYIGDYDSAAWMTSQLPSKWDHFRRNDLIQSWGWGPQLMERGMPIFDEYLRTCTPRDPVWASDNGAGYLNPTQLFTPRSPSGLPSGVTKWQQHCHEWFQRLGIRQVGFVIDGGGPPFTHAQQSIYEPFAGDGVITHTQFRGGEGPHLIGSMPVVGMAHVGLDTSPQSAAAQVAGMAGPGQLRFLPVRSILKDPGYYYDLNRHLQRNYSSIKPTLLDQNWFFYLMRHSLQGKNNSRAMFLGDTVPSEVFRGRSHPFKAWIRNIGWDSWSSSGGPGYRVAVVISETQSFDTASLIPINETVAPGGMIEIQFDLDIPDEEGTRYFLMDVVDPEGRRFGEKGNPFLLRRIDLTDEPVGITEWFDY